MTEQELLMRRETRPRTKAYFTATLWHFRGWLASFSVILLLGCLLTGATPAAGRPASTRPMEEIEEVGRNASNPAMIPIEPTTPAQPATAVLPLSPDDWEGMAAPTRAATVGSGEAYAPAIGIWISGDEVAALPMSGPAWRQLQAAADQEPEEPDISDQSQQNSLYILAKALVYARTGQRAYRDEVVENLRQVMGTERGGQTLALGRHLVTYVIAADLVNLPADPEIDRQFREWLRQMLTAPMADGRSLQMTHELRPNNWGTHAGASRAAVAVYLGDTAELHRVAQVFKGWLGDRSAYAGFEYGRLDWQADRDQPVGINPPAASKDGHSVDGALPEEMRRAGKFRWPPKQTDYAWEGLQGAIVQAEILSRAGYPAWEWEERALLRAVEFLYRIEWPAEGDDEWQIWLINAAYGADFPLVSPARPGKNMGWTDWTHAQAHGYLEEE